MRKMRSTVSYNAVYFIITKAYGFLGKKTSRSTCTLCTLSPFFLSFWALSSNISFVSGQILSQNVWSVMISLIISAFTKTPNSKTKTTVENVDFTSDILSHLRFLNIMAVILSTTRVAESKIWHLYVVFRTERQPNWIPKRKDKKKQITVSLTTSLYVTFLLFFFSRRFPSLHFTSLLFFIFFHLYKIFLWPADSKC